MCQIDNFEVYENNGGGLTIVLYAGEEIVYVDASMEYCPDSLAQIIVLFYQGLTIEDVQGWDSDISKELWEGYVGSLSYDRECIMDACNVYYKSMGCNAIIMYNMLVYECDIREETVRMRGGELYDYWYDNCDGMYFYNWYREMTKCGVIKVIDYVR